METASKELLKLEWNSYSTSSFESALLICKEKDSDSQRKRQCLNGEPSTTSVQTSQVLGKVKDFLGTLSEANKKLQMDAKDNPESYDIEVLNGNESEIIEMDLMLGIADLHTPEAVAAAESSVAGCYPGNSLAAAVNEADSEDSSDDDDTDLEENDIYQSKDNHGLTHTGLLGTTKRPESVEEDLCGEARSLRRRKNPKIEVLS